MGFPSEVLQQYDTAIGKQLHTSLLMMSNVEPADQKSAGRLRIAITASCDEDILSCRDFYCEENYRVSFLWTLSAHVVQHTYQHPSRIEQLSFK